MASLLELKKHLHSIQMTGQLAGAMKTVSAAKLNRLNSALQSFSAYQSLCQQMIDRFGSDLTTMFPCQNPEAPVCYVLLGANRGLCGGYNIELYSYTNTVLAKDQKDKLFIVAGKHAIAHYESSSQPIYKSLVLPDNLRYEDCMALLDEITSLYETGAVSAVVLVYQRFVNMLTQVPATHCLLPLSSPEMKTEPVENPSSCSSSCSGSCRKKATVSTELYVPDRETVLQAAARTCLQADFYSHMLEAGAGNQAATLIAMRSAFDNAEESAAELESAISRKRQSDVTSSVIETAGGFIEE